MRSRSRWISSLALVLVAALTLGACGGESSGGDEAAGAPLVIGTGGVLTENNNPFAPTSSSTANGWAWLIYEPLVQVNPVNSEAEPEPWLASEFEWSADFTTVTFTVRDGVTWSDGEPLTAEDVAFTFTLIKDNEALNSSALPYESVTVEGDTVTVAFGESQFVNQSQVVTQFVVPEHIWSAVPDPATYTDAQPVGTGPFVFESSSSSVARLAKNETYWQADDVQVGSVVYQTLQDNNAILNALVSHEVDWAGAFVLDLQSGFLDRAPETNKTWAAPKLGIHAFWVNTAREPFDDVNLRRAMSMVIDRQRASDLATGGQYGPITSVTGLPQPVGDPFIAPEFQGQTWSRDVEGAKALLAESGYTLSGDTLTDPDGNPVTMVLQDPSGWTDYLTELQVIQDNLAEIGISTELETPSFDAWNAAINSGEFDGAMRYTNSGATPYDLYANFMDGEEYVPVGETADSNFARFQSESATRALETYRTSADEEARQEALAEVQRVFVAEVPVIPLVNSPTQGHYHTENWTGWPSAEDPYASPGILERNISQVMTELEPADES